MRWSHPFLILTPEGSHIALSLLRISAACSALVAEQSRANILIGVIFVQRQTLGTAFSHV